MELIRKILIPLNGLDLAEEAIPYGEELIKANSYEVILLHVCEHGHEKVHRMHHLYLERVAATMRERLMSDGMDPKNIKIQIEHVVGDFVKEIIKYETSNEISLVIMAAFDTSIKERVFGSAVEKVFRGISCPILLIRVSEIRHIKPRKELVNRILLPLDGSAKSEVAIPLAKELALKYDAELALFMMGKKASYESSESDMVGEVGMYDEGKDRATREECYAYLEKIEKKIKSTGLNTSIGVSLGNDPAREIRAYKKKVNADMVVLATRSKAPISNWPSESAAFRLLEIGHLPFLLVKKPK